jgi:hypothetical protein
MKYGRRVEEGSGLGMSRFKILPKTFDPKPFLEGEVSYLTEFFSQVYAMFVIPSEGSFLSFRAKRGIYRIQTFIKHIFFG